MLQAAHHRPAVQGARRRADTGGGRVHDRRSAPAGSYTILKDPKKIFGFQNVVPIFSKKTTAAEGPAFSQTINAVSAKLTVPAMQQMNAAVDLDKNNPAEVAKKFL
jgi:glycine betaine/choline ABC-type transport system substrate-binding protein